jgi:protein-L-isoaspartate(D-aspartate) O-methyltransferase
MRDAILSASRLLPVAAALVGALAFAAAPAAAQEDFGCAKTSGTVIGGTKSPLKGTGTAGLNPPLNDGAAFIKYMMENRGGDRAMLEAQWNRYAAQVRNGDLRRDKEKRAFLVTPRDEFSRTRDPGRAYAPTFLDIGCGVTISGPGIVAHMTNELDVKPGEKALEIGTGSGYQAAILSALTDKVYSIEIIPPLAKATDRLYAQLAGSTYKELANIKRKTADGYYGWEEEGPFDKIIVTAGIDHIPPPLLRQLKPGGIMVIPVGQPGCQQVLKITKERMADGKDVIKRQDIYENRRVSCRATTFVAFTKYDAQGRPISRFGGRPEDK